jgi:hypothetical protein
MCRESLVPVSLCISDALSFVRFYRQTPLPTFRSYTSGLPIKEAFTAETNEAVDQGHRRTARVEIQRMYEPMRICGMYEHHADDFHIFR